MLDIGIDFDDVIADFTPVWLQVLESEKGIKLRYRDIVAWRLEELFPEINEEEIKETMRIAWKEKAAMINLVSNRIPTILDSLSQFFKIYITTATLADDSTIKNWLKQKGINYDKLLHVKHHSEKLNENIFAYVEDNPLIAAEFPQFGKKVILLERPWNKNVKASNNVMLVENWDEIENALMSFAGKKVLR